MNECNAMEARGVVRDVASVVATSFVVRRRGLATTQQKKKKKTGNVTFTFSPSSTSLPRLLRASPSPSPSPSSYSSSTAAAAAALPRPSSSFSSYRVIRSFGLGGGRRSRIPKLQCFASDGVGEDEEFVPEDVDDGNLDREGDLNMHQEIPSTSDSFLKHVSSRAYDMRRKLEQNLESSSYAVLEVNPWRDDPKPLYVLAQEDRRLLTMRTRRARSEVEHELELLFPKQGSRRGSIGSSRNKSTDQSAVGKSNQDSHLRMLVEDVREGVLVFEDEEDAAQYCNLLDGQGQGCMGVAELEASDVFAVCQKTSALAVFFRRGTTLPLPSRLQHDLKARKRSLED